MNGIRRLALAGIGSLGLAAATTPAVLSQIEGGLWEVARPGATPEKLCIASPLTLVQVEHRNASCTQDVLRDAASGATINYSCAGGGFGHSTVKVITRHSLRIETQGISDNAPFKYVVQARRLGNCPAH